MRKVLAQDDIPEGLAERLTAEAESAKKEADQLEEFCDYLQRGFLSSTHPNGYKNWSYAESLANGEVDDTTNNAAEALNSQFGKFALVGVTSYAEMLTRTYEFHICYTESCAEKRENDKMNRRKSKINQKIQARIEKIRTFQRLPREEQDKVFNNHLQLFKLSHITNQKTSSQEFSDDK